MLREFLETIQNGEVQSLLEISRTLNISPAIALQLADELTDKGYLQEIGVDCGTPKASCSTCPMGHKCMDLTRRWFITEKGKKAIKD